MKLKAAPYVINLFKEEEQIKIINRYKSNIYVYIANPTNKVTEAHLAKFPTNNCAMNEYLNIDTVISKFNTYEEKRYHSINLAGIINDEDNNFVYNDKIPFKGYEYIFSSYWIKYLKIDFNKIKADPETVLKFKSIYMQSIL